MKQYNSGPLLGGLKELASRTMTYVSFINFTLMAITAYEVSLRTFFHQYIPWMSFALYFSLLILLVIVAMVIEYKFIIPSHYTFLNKQEYQHQSLLARDLQLIKEHLGIKDEDIVDAIILSICGIL